jgi:hypothetical protein
MQQKEATALSIKKNNELNNQTGSLLINDKIEIGFTPQSKQ